jgi:hypothetical protein
MHYEPILPARRQPAGPVQGRFANSRTFAKSLQVLEAQGFATRELFLPKEGRSPPTRQRSVSFPVF